MMPFFSLVLMMIYTKYEFHIYDSFRDIKFFNVFFKSVTSVWPWNVGQRSNVTLFLKSLGMASYTLSIYFSALKPTVKKLLAIEIVPVTPRNSQNYIKKNIGHRKLPWTNLRKGPPGIIFNQLVLIWLLCFSRRRFFNINQFLKVLALLWPWNKGQGQIWWCNFFSLALTLIYIKYEFHIYN